MTADLLQFVNVIAVPVVGGLIIWLWKLDQRIFEISRGALTRDEFLAEMHSLRSEISELRKVVKS